jgi:ATP-binding cassette subfamily F protein 2
MPSDRKKKQAALKKNPSRASIKSEASEVGAVENSSDNVDTLASALEEAKLNDRSCTGVLGSHPQSRDVHFISFGLLYHGHELLSDTTLELNYGRWAVQVGSHVAWRATWRGFMQQCNRCA